MANVRGAIRQAGREELTGLGLGLPSEATETRFQRTLTLVAASKVLDRLDAASTSKGINTEFSPEGDERLSVSVIRSRWSEVVVPSGFEDEDSPERHFSLVERKAKVYKPYPLDLRGIWPLMKTHSVRLVETGQDLDDECPPITLRGSNKLGVNEAPTSIEEITLFNNSLALIARAEGFDRELAAQELFLPQRQPATA